MSEVYGVLMQTNEQIQSEFLPTGGVGDHFINRDHALVETSSSRELRNYFTNFFWRIYEEGAVVNKVFLKPETLPQHLVKSSFNCGFHIIY